MDLYFNLQQSTSSLLMSSMFAPTERMPHPVGPKDRLGDNELGARLLLLLQPRLKCAVDPQLIS